MTGPLAGLRIIEIAGIGPGPFCGMMLADQGADVVRVDRRGGAAYIAPDYDVMNRSRRSILLDLKRQENVEVVRDLARNADAIFEGFRPGVMERLGLGPDVLQCDNPRLVYGRITGWGQDGPYAQMAGHDINYAALSGTLHGLGRAGQKPTPPINLVADFGGGGMLLAFGMVSAILSARTTGRGQVVDCAMNEGAALLSTMLWGLKAAGAWKGGRGTNLLDTGADFYDTYETADGGYVSIGPIEPEFYAEFRRLMGLDADPDFEDQHDESRWPARKARLEKLFLGKSREEWCGVFDGSNACFAPVLGIPEAAEHPHNRARSAFVDVDGVIQPAPAPRFSETPSRRPRGPRPAGADGEEILRELGYDADRIRRLLGPTA